MLRAIPLLILLACLAAEQPAHGQEDMPRNRFEHDILVETFGFDETTPASVEFQRLYQGCPARDCIPSIDDPEYVAAGVADTYVAAEELVMAIEHNGDKRAWPIRVLDRHEIVNDVIGGDPIAVTWCPLCGSGLAFRRKLDGEIVEFGVSGVLHDSDLVMYDRTSESLWQQITGEAIMGPALGSTLDEVPVTITTWKRWREAHPDTRVLSLETGFDIEYGDQRRYGEYEQSERLPFPPSRRDLTIHPKTVVHGFTIGKRHLAVLDESLGEGPLETTLGDHRLIIRRAADGSVYAEDQHDRRHSATRLFWFAWFNFHPDTERI